MAQNLLQQSTYLSYPSKSTRTHRSTKAFLLQFTAENTCQKTPSAKFLLQCSAAQVFNMLRKKLITSPSAVKVHRYFFFIRHWMRLSEVPRVHLLKGRKKRMQLLAEPLWYYVCSMSLECHMQTGYASECLGRWGCLHIGFFILYFLNNH